jgi:hypothetical protein
MIKYSVLICSLFLLGGCATSNVIPLEQKYPANLTVRCEPLPTLKGSTLGDLYKYTIAISTMYNECAVRHDALSEAVTK